MSKQIPGMLVKFSRVGANSFVSVIVGKCLKGQNRQKYIKLSLYYSLFRLSYLFAFCLSVFIQLPFKTLLYHIANDECRYECSML